ncbi:twin-arginine translocase subunit TatC [Haloechinothrix sp. LS1_15]|uniref:twin-arginine translocase subunit TatC n=1 Tax=Haloechinothrix sp. LS1_15 TaxID=2652248 RepID=UPI0029466C84|nr:twin-arginine translocase subunit TatC [Haloechinothrix sp. LS1_15]MDV6013997.1 twin-arginine translocase subunit TatC [Haloechinothrix sp. LS1_15]
MSSDGASKRSAWSVRREARRRRSRRYNPDGSMTLIEHIYEFRRRLLYALLAVCAGGAVGFVWFAHGIGPLPALGDVIKGPYCDLPSEIRLDTGGGGCQLLQTAPFEAFMIQLKVGIAAGMVLTGPLWLYQLWAFLAPGLYNWERKYARIFVCAASVLFAAGAALAVVIVPLALTVLVGFGGETFVTALRGQEYVSFVLALLLIFGISFELPLLIVMLNRVGVVQYEQLKRWRRGIIAGLFVFAAFVTPTDPFSMVALAVALTGLFELAIQFARMHDRKLERRREAEGLAGLSDDEAAPFHYTPTDTTGAVEPSTAAETSGRRGSTDDVT